MYWLLANRIGGNYDIENTPSNDLPPGGACNEAACKGRPVSMIVKAKGPSGPAKVHSDDPKHALGLVQYLRTIGYEAWIEDTNGNEIEEAVLKNAIKLDVPARS